MFASSWFRPANKRHRPTTRLAVEPLEDRLTPSGDYLLVSSYKTDNVLRYEATTGAFVDEFIAHRDGGLNQPWGVVIGPRDHDVYVSTGHFQGPGQIKAVLRYDGATGTFLDQFVQTGQMPQLHAVIFGPDGNLYVGDRVQPGHGRIARFDGTTGAYLNDFVPVSSGGLGHPVAQVFGPNGRGGLDLYVSDEFTHSILRYDGTTGAFVGAFVPGGSGGLVSPTGLVFGSDGNLYVSDASFFQPGGPGTPQSIPAVLRFQGPAGPTPGAFMGAFVPAGRGGLLQPFGVLFGPDRNGDGRQDLYVTSCDVHESSFQTVRPHSSSVKVYDGVTGGYLADFVSVNSGGLNLPLLMTFTETDPVTLAYSGAGGAAVVASPSGNGTTAAAVAIQVNVARPDNLSRAVQPTLCSFTVTLSATYDQAVTMSFRTVDGTSRTSDSDYITKTGTLTLAPGETTKTITIEVNGESKKEADETFYLDLFAGSSNSLFTKNRGIAK